MTRFLPLIARPGPVLDLAAGSGRHTRLALDAGYTVTAVDKDVRGLTDLLRHGALEVLSDDLENPERWPLSGRRFAGIVVTNYLWRPRFDDLLDLLAPGGVLIYETFAVGNGRFGRPSDPTYLLRTGELLQRVSGRLQVVAYEHGEVAHPKAAVVQRIVAANDLKGIEDPAGDPEPRPVPMG